ncbi:hypothetical protein D3C73_1510940 [compost metagenome]
MPVVIRTKPAQARERATGSSLPPMVREQPAIRNPIIKYVVKISAINTPCAVNS